MREVRRPTPDHLRKGSIVAVVLAGTSTGLLGGIGWRLLRAGALDMALTLWLLALTALAGLLLVAATARSVAALLDRGVARYRAVLEDFESRLQRLERELLPPPARSPQSRVELPDISELPAYPAEPGAVVSPAR